MDALEKKRKVCKTRLKGKKNRREDTQLHLKICKIAIRNVSFNLEKQLHLCETGTETVASGETVTCFTQFRISLEADDLLLL